MEEGEGRLRSKQRDFGSGGRMEGDGEMRLSVSSLLPELQRLYVAVA